MSESTSFCPFCLEAIKPGARKCPHCHQWQGRQAYYPTVLIALLMLPLILLLMMNKRREIGSPDHFERYQDQISVVVSSLHHAAGGEKCGPTVSVIGKIKNNSDVAWKDVYLEAQYFDAHGTMIDTNGAEQYGLVIPAHEEVAFRIRGSAAHAALEYTSHKVFVRSARDARALF